jgi:peroxiredoxin
MKSVMKLTTKKWLRNCLPNRLNLGFLLRVFWGVGQMDKSLKVVAAAILIFCFAVAAHAGAGTGLIIDPSGNGDSAPEFKLEEFGTGKMLSLGDYLGKKVVMLEFWATWCDICKSEMPRLVSEYNEWKDKKYELIAITLSDGGANDLKKIAALKKKYKIEYPIVLDTTYEVATKLYKLAGPIPLKIIIDCAGKLRYEHVGDFADGVSEVPFVLEQLLSEPACQD